MDRYSSGFYKIFSKRRQAVRPVHLLLSGSRPWDKSNVPPLYYEAFRDISFPNPPNFKDSPDPYADRFNTPEFWENVKPLLEQWRRGYYAMVNLLDDELCRLLKAISDAGIADDTIFIYTSDHGEMMGSQGRVQKLTFYEEAARVPFLIRWPGHTPEGKECDACINTPDIAPTILGLLGLDIPEEMEGMDLSHLALGQSGPEPDFAFMQGMGHTYLWIDGSEWRAVRDKRYTYTRYLRDGSEHLYDNLNDPYQTRNLVKDPGAQAVLKRMRDAMMSKMASLKDEFKTCTWYRDHWTAPDDPYSVTANAYGPFRGPYAPVPSNRGKLQAG
jgi:arylsulfatase A-like enzyme